jgi:glycosyltransferase involved in cell wall biosynthesis
MPNILVQKPKLRLIIGGQGEDRPRLQQLADKLGISNHIMFTGFIPPEDISVYFAIADIFVFHSTYETFGMVLAEAMNYGKAVISVNDTAIKEVVDDGETGILVPSMDHKAFGEEVLRLLNDRSRRSKFEINARKKAQRHFKWDTIASNYERVLRTKALKTSNVC